MKTVLDHLVAELEKTAHHNSQAEAAPAVVLWTDPERLWSRLIEPLRSRVRLLEMGDYAPGEGRGPLAWIKAALAGQVPAATKSVGWVPVVYLPGVSIATLRDARECPVKWHPLIELVHRGVAWCQSNGRDVTPQAFLANKEFLKLDLARDTQTSTHLASALPRLMACDLEQIAKERIDAAFLQELLQPDLVRSVLAWLNNPEGWKATQTEGWMAFVQAIKTKAKFDVERAGALSALDRFVERKGFWSEVWNRFEAAPKSYPGILTALRGLPETGLVTGATVPAVNLTREESLRHRLEQWIQGARLPSQGEWQELQAEVAERSGWLWAHLGESPVLELLQRIMALQQAMSGAGVPIDWLEWHRERGWKVDEAALEFATVQPGQQTLAKAWLRLAYLPWLERIASRFQEDLKKGGVSAPRSGQIPSSGELQLFVDGLRMDLAQRLVRLLQPQGISCTLEVAWSALPSVTATGKALASPVASQLEGGDTPEGFAPRFGGQGALFAVAAMRSRLAQADIQCEGNPEEWDASGKAWMERGDFDSDGHAQGWRLAARLDSDLQTLAYQILELGNAGWNRIRVVTDHGWLLVPDGLPSCALPKACAEERWGRCAVLKPGVDSGLLELPWSWNTKVLVAYAPGIACFKAGEEYAHGGLSPQEMILPSLVVEFGSGTAPKASARIAGARWTRLKCRVELESAPEGALLDLRRHVGDPGTSLLAEPKRLAKGDEVVSLFVEDDERDGTSAYLVLEVNGTVVDKRETVVGDSHAAG